MMKEKTMFDLLKCLVIVAVALFVTTSAGASTLMLDFGSGTLYTGTNDPAHADGTVSMAYTDWKGITNGASQVVTDSDSNSITVDMGRAAQNETNDSIDMERDATAYNPLAGTGIFGTDLTYDAMFSYNPTQGTIKRDPIGALITGLPLGDYYVYVVAHTGRNETTSLNVRADSCNLVSDGVAGLNDLVDIYTSLSQGVTLAGGNTSNWMLGTNYARFTISLTSGAPKLFVASDQAQGAQGHSSLSAIVITTVPEPATLGLLLLGGVGVLLRKRR
ncbi:MAG TPA: hypothetical protein DCX07_11380 [Phycisphaerales bacterium]|nr:hypothetical protein [Phycisphaerales bacterium]